MQYPSYIKSVKKSTRRKNSRLLKILVFGFILIFSVSKLYSIRTDVFGGGGNDTEISIDIEQGATSKQIASLLKEHKIIQYPFIFRLVAKTETSNDIFQFGRHTLKSNMSYKEIIEAVSTITVPSNAVTVTIIEGSEIGQTAQKLYDSFNEKGLEFDVDVFLNECEKGEFDYPFIQEITRKKNRLEGYLFPATYTFTAGTTERDVIIAMLNKFALEYNDEFIEKANQFGFTTDEVITLASIIEREGASVDEFKIVSSVFHNRLKSNMKLDSCATIQYVLGERKEVLSTADTRINSPYNTYQHFGLPVGPIASPGAAAIEAALNPAETDYYYFVLSNGKHVFSRTYREHLNAQQ